MNFSYLKTEQYLDSINIEDIGNCYLQVYNDDGDSWILSIETELGWTETKQAGPFILDSDNIGTYFYYNKIGFDFKDKKIKKQINDFINNPKKCITQVLLISQEEFNEKIHKIIL